MRQFWRTLTSDKIEGKTIYVLAILILIQSFYPFTESGNTMILFLGQFVYGSYIFIGILVTRNNPRLVRTLYLAAIMLITAGIIYMFNQGSVWAITITYVAYIIMYLIVTMILIRYLFHTNEINRDVIYAAIAIYILLGAIFVPLYGLIDTFTLILSDGTVNAFTGSIAGEGVIFAWQDFVYYSYVTLTTLGYGDILPATFLAKWAVTAEAIIGVLYITIVMARLVGLYSADINQTNHTIDS